MPFLIAVLEVVCAVSAIVAWVLVPEMLWKGGDWFLAIVAFFLISAGLITLMNRYDEWRKNWLERHNRW